MWLFISRTTDFEAIRAEENKLRRPEKFISENDINAFYSKAIPENITSTKN